MSQTGIRTLNLCPWSQQTSLIDSFRSVKNGKQWPTITASVVLRPGLNASPTRSTLKALYPDKEAVVDKGRAEVA